MISELHGLRIGIMGGTFDPIHYGHLMLAEQIRTSFHLDKVYFIPVGKAPHKSTTDAVDKYKRFEMTKLATESNPYFFVSDLEINKEEVTYTIDTIKAIKSTLSPNDTLFFITGADALLLLESWKEFYDLIHLVTFVGATRPGVDNESLALKIQSLQVKYQAKIELCFIPALAISSTEIRQRVNQEKSIKYLLPESVEAYIHKHFLYKEHHPRFYEMLAYLKNSLSNKRFNHSLETAHISRKLAIHYSQDPINAEMAGLCHDLAKEYKNSKMISLIDAYSIYKDPCVITTPNLAHGEVAAGIMKHDLGFSDEELLDAIRWHTYGHKDMSMLSKIVYIADIIENSRNFDGVELLRTLAFQDIDDTILAFGNQCEKHLLEKNLKTHEYTKAMLSQIKYIKSNSVTT